MGRYNFAPQRVHQAASRLLQASPGGAPPPWYRVVGNLPPSERLVRPALQPARRKGRKASKLFQPLKLEYEEDTLRSDFFGDHPWELARPRQVLENDGKDYQKHDWSRMEQPGKQLDGESVVQRQQWLMGLVCHEIDFACPPAARDHLRSADFQDTFVQTLKDEHNVTAECDVPSDLKDLDADVNITLRLTYHPRYPHDFRDGVKSVTQLLRSQGVDTAAFNKRSFTVAFQNSDKVAQLLHGADLDALGKKYKIDLALEPVVSTKPFAKDPVHLQPIRLTYHRNATTSLPDLVAHLTNLLQLSSTDLISRPLPTADPDTYSAYTRAAAYDVARKEFYDLRHAEEIEARVAREEALFTGAHFGPGALDVGMAIEDEKYEEWRVWAAKEIAVQNQLAGASYTGIDNPDAELGLDDESTQAGLDELADSVPGSKAGLTAQGGAIVHP